MLDQHPTRLKAPKPPAAARDTDEGWNHSHHEKAIGLSPPSASTRSYALSSTSRACHPSPWRTSSLDGTAFPHIVDTVFAFADRDTLLTLRTVSKEFNKQADKLLFVHIALFPNQQKKTVEALSRAGQRLPLIPTDNWGGWYECYPVDLLYDRFIVTQAVDVYPLRTEFLSLSLEAFPALELARDFFMALRTPVMRLPTEDLPPPYILDAESYKAQTVVRDYQFPPLTGNPAQDADILAKLEVWEWFSDPASLTHEYNEEVRREIVCLRWQLGSREHLSLLSHPWFGKGVVEAVLVLEPEPAPLAGPHLNVLAEIARIPVPESLKSLTIVGIEKLSLWSLGYTKADPTEEMRNFAEVAFAYKAGKADVAQATLTFWEMARALYREQVRTALVPVSMSPWVLPGLYGYGVRQKYTQVTFMSTLGWKRNASQCIQAKGLWTRGGGSLAGDD